MRSWFSGRRQMRVWLVAAATWVAASAVEAQAPLDKVDPEVVAQTEGGNKSSYWVVLNHQADLRGASDIKNWEERGRFVYEQLRSVADSGQAGCRTLLTDLKVEHRSFWICSAIYVTSGRSELEVIAARTEVALIMADGKYHVTPHRGVSRARVGTVEWGIDRINADEVWSGFGVQGEGVVVGHIDTGVDFTHSALVNQYRGNLGGGIFDHNYNWWDPSQICGPPGSPPCDNNSHGTHTMGTIAGGDGLGPFENDVGVAPGVRWMTAKGCESSGCSFFALLSSGQFMLAPTDLFGNNPNPDVRPHVVSNSWGGGGGDMFYFAIVDAWRAAGMFPVFSNGNPGDFCGGVGSPADYEISFGVGATDIFDTAAWFSGRGPSSFGPIKPDAAAPGVDVRSSVPGEGYSFFSGTSMAAPHVAGTVALIWSAAPGMIGDVTATFDLLKSSARDTIDFQCGGDADGDPNNVYGDGIIDAFAAVSAAPRIAGTLTGIVSDAATSAPIQGARVDATRDDDGFTRRATTDGTGSYRLILPIDPGPGPEAYTVMASAFGYGPASAGAAMNQDATTVQDLALTSLPRYTVSGTVEDDEGNPVEGAKVEVLATPIAAVLTDASGHYEIAGVPEGVYDFQASASKCNDPHRQDGVVVSADLALDFTLPARFDSFGYRCRVVPFDWVEATGSVSLSGDDGSVGIDLPFSFPLYDGLFDQAWVATNGFLNFLGFDASSGNGPLPTPFTPNAAIYPFWDDLYVATFAADSVKTETLGTAPDRVWVLEYEAHFCCISAEQLNFEVKLHERTGEIEFLYRSMPGRGNGETATVGIENASGSSGFQYSFDEEVISDGLAIRFIPPVSGTIQGVVSDANDGLGVGGATVTAFRSGGGGGVGDFARRQVVGGDLGGGSGSTHDAGTQEYTSVSTTSGDIWDCGDSFEFAYTRFSGNFDIAVQLTDRQHSTGFGRWGKFGLMARRSLAVDSRFTMVQDHLPDLQDPARVGMRTIHEVGCGGMNEVLRSFDVSDHPVFQRLTRRGDTLQGWYSDNPGLADGSLDPCNDANWSLATEDDWGGLASPALFVGFANSLHNSSGMAEQTIRFKLLCFTGTKAPIPEREAVTRSDGTYRMGFLPLGDYQLTATAERYAAGAATATLATDDQVLVKNFALPSARADIAPVALEFMVPTGESRTRTLTLRNPGGLNLLWELTEGGGRKVGVTGVPGQGQWLSKAASGVRSGAANHPSSGVAHPASYRWEPHAAPAAPLTVLVYADDSYHGAPFTYPDQALQRLGLPYTAHYNSDFFGFETSLASQPWDLVLFADEGWTPPSTTRAAVNNYVAAGGMVVLSDWAVGQDPGNPLWSTLGFSWVGNDFDPPDPIRWWEPSHPIFNEPESVPQLTSLTGFRYNVYGQRVEPLGGAEAVAGATPGPAPNQAAMVLANDNRTVFKGVVDGHNDADLDLDGTPDGVELWVNLIEGIQNGFATDVTWLTEDVTAGNLAPGGTQAIRVTANATGLAVGIYEAKLTLLSNSGRNPKVVIPVRLIVPAYMQLVNSGGAKFVDSEGDTWAADVAYSAGKYGFTNPLSVVAKTTNPISGTVDDKLYQDARLNPTEYRFDNLPAGVYEVDLRFTEYTYQKVLGRVFDVTLEGELVLSLFALDIYDTVGRLTAAAHKCYVPVNDGRLNVRFVQRGIPVFDIPIVQGIGITHRPDKTPSTLPECSHLAVENPGALDVRGDGDPVFYLRGDSDSTGSLDITDAIAILGHLFSGSAAPACMKSADANDDGRIDLSDPIYVLGFLFLGDSEPREPFLACGPDPTPDDLSCDGYRPCE